MKKEVKKRSPVLRRALVFLVIIALLYSMWFIFFRYEDCRDKVCFDSNLESCDRAKFIYGDDMIFEYVIKGKSKGDCEVEVTLLQGELNNADSLKLEGQSMNCFLPSGVVTIPESDISVCHGLLKEGLQDLVINKLHTYLVQNLGRLNLEFVKIPQD